MRKYIMFFSYADETWARMIAEPGDRTAAIQRLADSVGGTLEAVYWMVGPYDGIVIIGLPDTASIRAIAAMISSTGAFKTAESHELLTQDELAAALKLASGADKVYQRPGSPG